MSAAASDSAPAPVDAATSSSPVNAPASPVEDTTGEPTEGGEPDQLTLRALVSTKEAGVIIGKAGKNVADLRDLTGVKAGVSKVVPGVNDRVLSVSGGVENVAYAFSEIARQLLETPLTPTTPASPPPNAFTSVRLLISHNLMGTIIGRQGLKIKQIQDVSGARMVASKEMLPQSTERVVEVQGTTEAVKVAILEIGRCLLEDYERGQGTVLYHPGAGGDAGVLAGGGAALPGLVVGGARRASAGFGAPQVPMGAFAASPGGGARRTSSGGPNTFQQQPPQQQQQQQSSQQQGGAPSAPKQPPSAAQSATASAPEASLRTQNISIPSDMVGCIIGRAGSKITEIRRLSGSKISIAKVPHDETGERMFTIVGTAESNEKALFLLYNQLESEKTRRVEGAEAGEGDEEQQ